MDKLLKGALGQKDGDAKADVDALREQFQKNVMLGVVSKWKAYCAERRQEKNKTDAYRKGPAPIEDADSLRKSINKATYGTLDSDVEELDFEEERVNGEVGSLRRDKRSGQRNGNSLASCRALIVYFSKLAKSKDEYETVDLLFVDSLLQSGADVNFSDRHGQTIMHEISRAWHPDVARFAIQHGADVNKADNFGRTPLHLASAVDYSEMVEFLVKSGANVHACTCGERQTPMHYAAKNNGTASLKTLLRLGSNINDRDYKQRTPLFVASETARSEAARYLIEHGAPVGVYDDSGTSCLSLMIEKMPHIAMEAIEQFHNVDRAFRKHYFYLSFLEKDPKFLDDELPKTKRERIEKKERDKETKRVLKEKGMKKPKKEKTFAKTPLEVIVQYNQLDLIMHPVFQRLLVVKWGLFGKFGSSILVSINLFYTLIWTFLGLFIPRDRNYYSPLGTHWWRLVLEIIGVLMTVYFIYMEITQVRLTEKAHNKWRSWRTRQVERDLEYCHPRWPEEKKYLESELQQVRTFQRTYFREPWNIFEWITYFVVLTLMVTRIMSIASKKSVADEIHPKVYSLGLIIIWLRFMRSCRAFRSLGPFIAILGSVIADTFKFAFLFFEFFIPYTAAFWILFGGAEHGKIMGPDSARNWANFNDLLFSVWSATLVGDFDWEGLVKIDRLMAQILVGTYFAMTSVVCLNLYIALLSDTFARVYAQAQANAVMQQAQLILSVEKALSKKKRIAFGHQMQKECCPLEVYARDEGNSPDDHENDMFERVSRTITNRIDELEDNLGQQLKGEKNAKDEADGSGRDGGGRGGDGGNGPGNGPGGGGGGGRGGGTGNIGVYLDRQSKQLNDLRGEIAELRDLLVRLSRVQLERGTSPPTAPVPVRPPPPTVSQQTLSPPPEQPQHGQGRKAPPSSAPSLYPSLPRDASRPLGFGSMVDSLASSYNEVVPQAGNDIHSQTLPRSGYGTDFERPKGRRRGRRGGKNRKGAASDCESDMGSTYSETLPMLSMQQRNPVPAGQPQVRGGKKGLSGSWDDLTPQA